jgi:hypothetical protein
LLNCLSAFHRLQPVHNPGFEIVGSFHFVASSSSFMPRNKGDRPRSGEEAGPAVRSRGSRRDREPSRRTANCRWHRSQAPGADRARMAGGKASPRNHAVPAPRRQHQPGGANLQYSFTAGSEPCSQRRTRRRAVRMAVPDTSAKWSRRSLVRMFEI